ncbi:MAG: hypothetical protein WBO46_10650 [Caldilineaceae bacterium]
MTLSAISPGALRRLPALLRQRGAAYLRDTWDSLRLDLADSSPAYRRLALLGYGLALLLIGALLGSELAGNRLPLALFTTSGYQRTLQLSVPIAAPPIYLLGWVAGWALILTGASDCRKRIFLPVAGYFVLAWLSGSGIAYIQGSRGFLLWLLPLLLLTIRLLSGRLAFWRARPGLEFLLWASVLSAFPLSRSGDSATVAASVYSSLAGVYIVGLPFWFWLGVDGADGVLKSANGLWESLGQVLGQELQRLAAPLTGLLAGLALLLTFVARPVWILPVVALAFALAGTGLARLRGRRAHQPWHFLLGVAFRAIAIAFFLYLAVKNIDTDINSIALHLAGLPPAAAFGLLLLYDIFTAGTRFANVDGRWLPRRARLLIYLGVIVLSAAFAFLALNVYDVERGAAHDLVVRNISFVTYAGLVLGGLWLLAVNSRRAWREALAYPVTGKVTGEADEQPQ